MPVPGLGISISANALIMLIVTFVYLWILKSFWGAAPPFYFFGGFTLLVILLARILKTLIGLPLS